MDQFPVHWFVEWFMNVNTLPDVVLWLLDIAHNDPNDLRAMHCGIFLQDLLADVYQLHCLLAELGEPLPNFENSHLGGLKTGGD